jgi:hypothetical protein
VRELAEIRLKPRRSNPYPPARADQIADFESRFGLVLPVDYVRFIQYVNGGYSALRLYPDPASGTEGEVNDFYGLGPREADEAEQRLDSESWDIGNLWGETRIWWERLGGGGIPFARDGGDNQLFLDYRVLRSEPTVSRLIFSTGRVYGIAESFARFIDSLR